MKSTIEDHFPLITLVGPPNSGKTTLFNLLSGKHYKTVNYPGSTVEYSTSRIHSKYGLNALLLDSPGIISLNPNSPDEEVSVNSLYDHPDYGSPNIVITTVDANQLSRHLLLSKQLIDAGFKVIIVVTMIDLLEKRGYKIDEQKFSNEIGCRVLTIDGKHGTGVEKLLETLSLELNLENSNGSPKPINKLSITNKEELISTFNFLESIEKKVIIDNDKISKDQLNTINKKLSILNPKLEFGNTKSSNLTLKIDRVLLNKKWGLVYFFLIMSLIFMSIFWFAEPFMSLVDESFGYLASSASSFLGDNWYGNLISDGIISGVGSVLVFLPQILVLFLILGLLEDTGYLARGAMLIDKPLSKIGLNGRSFVPMLSGFACAIPAILAARTIQNKRERFLTIFIIPLMSCSARLPVYVLLIAFLTPADKPWIAGFALATIYIFSIISSILVAAVINKLRNRVIKTEDNSSFILELPTYKMPKVQNVLRNTYDNAKQYIMRAGPIIFFLSVIIWTLTYFPNNSPQVNQTGLTHEQVLQVEKADRLSGSYAASLGKFIQPVMSPLGMDWRVGVSLITAFAAREVFVSSLALIFKVTDESNLQSSILKAMKDAKNEETGKKLFTTSTIVGLIIFFVFALQCISTIAVSKKETGGWRIPMLQLIIFTSTAYILTFIAVNGLRFLGLN
jgi:ferrous iron transport protein B